MAMTELPLAEVRNRLSELVADVERTHERVTVTKHGHPAAVLVSPDDLASLEETLDILSTPGALEEIREGEEAIARGETFDEETIRADLARRMRHARPT
jgi:antitoxin YefM